MRFVTITFSILLVLMTSTQRADASLVVGGFAGQLHVADGYSNFNTTVDSMIGLRVDVYFQGGTSDSALWTASGISQADWSMTQGPGTTFTNPFTITNNSNRRMTRFVMHGAGSSTIFDRSVSPSTAGTANGRDVQEFTSLRFSQDITANYFDEVKTTGSSGAVGDIFAGLDISFSRGINRFGGQFVFRTDTDITVGLVRAAVPEPTTIVQLTIGLACFSLRRRRRNINSK